VLGAPRQFNLSSNLGMSANRARDPQFGFRMFTVALSITIGLLVAKVRLPAAWVATWLSALAAAGHGHARHVTGPALLPAGAPLKPRFGPGRRLQSLDPALACGYRASIRPRTARERRNRVPSPTWTLGPSLSESAAAAAGRRRVSHGALCPLTPSMRHETRPFRAFVRFSLVPHRPSPVPPAP